MFARIKEDIDCILQRDPAARTRWEVFTCYPGLHAIWLHRWANACWRHGFKWLGRFVSHFARWLTGIEIHPAARIGRRVFIDHGMGVVVGETAEIGDDCTIYQGVTLGGTSLFKGTKRHPTLGRGVIVGANAMVLGGFTVGDGAKIGSAAVVVHAVPSGATAVGNPARIIQKQRVAPHTAAPPSFPAYAVTRSDDPLSIALRGLIDQTATSARQIELLWQALEKIAREHPEDLPAGARRHDDFDPDRLRGLVK